MKKKDNKKNQNKQPIIDLTSYLSPDMVNSDVNGSYTGVTADMYYNDELEDPVQDADDL
ncbi:MAG: hypothetical protein K2H13_04045 [Eubacterium sp.]|nr:hypothetical protein [Eubacterium sp.]MDE6469868.1 hypothetical protein [Eubacterium sp.]